MEPVDVQERSTFALFLSLVPRAPSDREIAKLSGVGCRTVRKWRAGKAEPSVGELSRLCEGLGVPMSRVFDPPPGPLDPGDPYAVVRQLLDGASSPGAEDGSIVWRKPLLGVVGPFDHGKTSFLNTLLGSDLLSVQFGPTTRFVTLLRHSDDRPVFAESDWSLLRGGHVTARHASGPEWASMCLGGADTPVGLEEFTKSEPEVGCVIVGFMNSPVLRGADLIDIPGTGHHRDEDEAARDVLGALDIVMWCSAYAHFLGESDRHALADLLASHRFPASPNTEPLRALFVVATHADTGSISEADLETIFDIGASKVWAECCRAAGESTGPPGLALEHLRARFFSFSTLHGSRSSGLYADLLELLGSAIPNGRLAPVRRTAETELWPEGSRLIREEG